MNSSPLVRLLGFPATLIHGDTLVLDRWLWLRSRLPRVGNGQARLLDVGCGSGAFTIGAALRGYSSLGLSWDRRNQEMAAERATICRAPLARFEVCDVRNLDERADLTDSCDAVICCENIEHILNDQKLTIDMARCLREGGVLLLTTPNIDYKPMSDGDKGPFLPIEDGAHVRKGYSAEDLRTLCAQAGLEVREIGFISGFFSQKITTLMRWLSKIHYAIGWAAILPLRTVPLLFDSWLSPWLGWPGYSITLVAVKPRRN
jgi:2-polyprenyl-3-methyl-5-hydroxy-6-metoxy-1,4-benzoquinol methylase